jgi:hypothetical protein
VDIGAPEVLLIELIFAVFCALVAARKRRFATGWAVLGFFFGILALLVIAVLPGRPTAGVPT